MASKFAKLTGPDPMTRKKVLDFSLGKPEALEGKMRVRTSVTRAMSRLAALYVNAQVKNHLISQEVLTRQGLPRNLKLELNLVKSNRSCLETPMGAIVSALATRMLIVDSTEQTPTYLEDYALSDFLPEVANQDEAQQAFLGLLRYDALFIASFEKMTIDQFQQLSNKARVQVQSQGQGAELNAALNALASDNRTYIRMVHSKYAAESSEKAWESDKLKITRARIRRTYGIARLDQTDSDDDESTDEEDELNKYHYMDPEGLTQIDTIAQVDYLNYLNEKPYIHTFITKLGGLWQEDIQIEEKKEIKPPSGNFGLPVKRKLDFDRIFSGGVVHDADEGTPESLLKVVGEEPAEEPEFDAEADTAASDDDDVLDLDSKLDGYRKDMAVKQAAVLKFISKEADQFVKDVLLSKGDDQGEDFCGGAEVGQNLINEEIEGSLGQ